MEAIVLSNPDRSDLDFVDPILNLDKVLPCPKPRTDDPKALATKGRALLRENMLGEHYAQGSVAAGLPVLRDAAISGSTEAAGTYVSIVNMFVHFEVIGDPLDRPLAQGSQEALLFSMLYNLRGNPPPPDSCDAALIDFNQPIDEKMFKDSKGERPPIGPCGGDYRTSWLSLKDIEALRQQARAWSTCWEPEGK